MMARASELERLTGLLLRPVGPADRQRAAAHLLDWLACAVGAGTTDTAAVFHRWATSSDSQAHAERHLQAGRASLQTALVADGALGNILEMDDIHGPSILHPGPIVVPAALATALALQDEGIAASPVQLLDALVRGYEAVIRIGSALGRQHYRFWHSTSSCGAFGAAAAAASLRGLDGAGWVSALGNAGSRTGGLWQMRFEQVASKSWHNAEACRSGALAAQLAGCGLTGVSSLLEGEQGLFAATAPGADAAEVSAGAADAPWLIHRTGFKIWPCCRHAHPVLGACRKLAQDLGTKAAEQITAVRLRTYGAAVEFCDKPQVATETDAKFSLQHVAALGLLGRGESLADYWPQHLSEEPLAGVRARVSVEQSAACDRLWPQHYSAEVRLELASGEYRELSESDARGDPDNPATEQELTAKAQMLFAAGGMATPAIQRLIAAVRALTGDSDLRPLRAVLP